ncbi:carbohydrate ABC transporter membrane protein 1, CUT1 family [Bauldia litoralis]|uniref:Carbohydrate ABC transporter membrane protein 1, CUT1 family n=2 Tax=Bauldia litoralis TaxID=665467 RepID=A0A1G6D6J5_9HYPH|nr:carbohydrate ABC transporter membrane protein 1, CUT1 family [Bauldia litoralis]
MSASDSPEQAPPRPPGRPRLGPMARREARLAAAMLAPTFLIVLAIVLIPLLANFWISFKPVSLADLRPPIPVVSERLRGDADVPGAELLIQYRLRNSSQDKEIRNVVLVDELTPGLTLQSADERCAFDGPRVRCDLGTFAAGHREEVELTVIGDEAFATAGVSPRDSQPLMTGDADNILTSWEFSFENFARIFQSRDFWTVVWVTIAYTVFGTLGAIVLGLFAAQLLNTSFRGRAILRGLFLFPYVAPVIAVAFTWVVLLDPFSGTLNAILKHMNVVDEGINFFGQRAVELNLFGLTVDFPLALATVIAFEAWRYFPLSLLFILARMQSIPADLYEAAGVDGATPFQAFRHVALPQLFAILSTLFLLRFIWTFNKFDDIFLLTGGAAGTRTLTVDVYEQGFALGNLGAGAAVAVVIFLFLLVFALSYFRFVHREEG